jgi:hypothetical protein
MFSFIASLFPNSDAGPDAPRFLSEPNRRNFDGMFNADPNEQDKHSAALLGDKFEPEQCYFSVRVVEMWLAEAGNYFSEFLPMCSCFLRYGYGTTTREVPCIISYDKILGGMGLTGDAGKDRGARKVDLGNIYVVKDAPVKAGAVTVYAGLSRIANSEFARGMLDLVGDAAATVGGSAVGIVAHAGVDMTKRLAKLLGADGVSTRFGVYDGDALVRSGYRVLAGAGLDAASVQMKDGQLRRMDETGNLTSVDDVDYLLLAFEYRKTLLDQPFGSLAHLPFHSKWTELTKQLINSKATGVDECFNQLAAEVVSSPDLTEMDRLGVLTTYVSQMDKWRQFRLGAPIVKAAGQTLRGMVIDSADALSDRKREGSANLLREAAAHINDYRDDPYKGDALLSDEALGDQLKSVGADLNARNPSVTESSEAINSLLVATYVP